MKKIPIIAALILAAATTASAEETALRIVLNNGSQEIYSLQEKPAVTFRGDDVCIATATVSADYPRSDVKSMDFIDKTAGIATPADGCTVSYAYDGRIFSCPGHDIAVYDLGGRAVAGGTGAVSLDSLVPAVYIVKVNTHTIKIIKK